MNPIEIIFCWQTITVAVIASGMTHFTKRCIDILRGMKDVDGNVDMWEAIGKELRRDSIVIDDVVLPGCVLFWGAVAAASLRLVPEVVLEYVATHAPGIRGYAIFASWGAVCGFFADAIFMKVRSIAAKLETQSNPNEG